MSSDLEAELARLELELAALAAQIRRADRAVGGAEADAGASGGRDQVRRLRACSHLVGQARSTLTRVVQARDDHETGARRQLRDSQARLDRLAAELAALRGSRLFRLGGRYWAFRRWLSRELGRARSLARPSRSAAARRASATPAETETHGSGGTPALVSVVIVTRDERQLLQPCLESLFRSDWPRLEVVVVDDGSRDGTDEYLAEAQRGFATLHVVLNDTAQGTPAARNSGLGRASGEILVLMSADTVVERSWLAPLVRELTRDPRLGLVAPTTDAAGNVGRETEVEQLDEACMGLRRETLEALGLPGEAGYPDRARLAGYRLARAHDSFVRHLGGAHVAGESPAPRDAHAPPRRRAHPDGLDPLFAAAERAAGVVVFPPSIGWAHTLFQRPQHLARAFAGLGYVVVFDCSNVPDEASALSEIEPRLFLYHGGPADLHGLEAPIVWTFPYNYHYGEAFPPGVRTVYDWIDDLSVFRVWDQALVRRNHAAALDAASLVAAVARPLHEEALRARSDAIYLPNAVDYLHFAEPRTPANDPKLLDPSGRPVAGYYGALARWLDDALLDETAALRPDWRFVLVGPMYEGGLRGASSLRRPNVVWTGPRDYGQIPAYAAWFDVALIPFKIDAITRATSPLKLYEYFAAGKPVVTTPMPECMAFPEVRIASTPAELSRALDAARADAADASKVARLRELGRANSWTARAQTALDRLSYSRAASG